MATINQLNSGLSGSTGTGLFVGSSSPSITTANLIGTSTNNNAAAGSLGEFVTANSGAAANFTTTGTYQNMTSIALTAGDWDVWYTTYMYQNSTASATFFSGGLSTTSITPPSTGALGSFFKGFLVANDISTMSGSMRVSLSGSGNAYLVGAANWSTGSAPQFQGAIAARRIR